MVQKLRSLIVKYWEIFSYIFFGGLTTAVNWLVYFPLYNLLHIDSAVSNVIAWVVSVAFAYLTNKPFVFKSHDWSAKTVLPELGKFVSARLFSGGFETFCLLLFVETLYFDGNIVKVVVSVAVVILNYIASKLVVFHT